MYSYALISHKCTITFQHLHFSFPRYQQFYLSEMFQYSPRLWQKDIKRWKGNTRWKGADRKEMRICIIAENGEMEVNKNEIDGRKDRTRQLDGRERWVRGELEEQEERDMTGYSAQRAIALATVRAPANSYMQASWFSVRATWSQRQSTRTRPLPGSVEWKQSPRWMARSQNSHVDYSQQTPTHQRIRDTQSNTQQSQHSLQLWAAHCSTKCGGEYIYALKQWSLPQKPPTAAPNSQSQKWHRLFTAHSRAQK